MKSEQEEILQWEAPKGRKPTVQSCREHIRGK